MAKRKSSKKTPNASSAARPTTQVQTSSAHRPPRSASPTPPRRVVTPTTTAWWWVGAGLLAAVLLIGAVLFSLRDRTPASSSAVVNMPTPTTAPTATALPTRPAEAPPGVVDYCRHSPKFRDTEGFSTSAVLSTVEQGVKGANMIEMDANGQVTRRYQHPTWDDAGYLGHVVLDRQGNVYTFPAPYVSLIDNPPELQNIIYRIDSTTAEMTRFYTLTTPAPITEGNPFGVMGLAYDCDTESLYASSVAGSTRDATRGQIVRMDLASREVRFRYEGVDAFGLGIYITPPLSTTVQADGQTTGKRLYYGLARAPEIYSIGMDAAGDLLDDIRLEITLPDPTLKARRLVFTRDGTLEVRSRPFDFNLIVTSERPEVVLHYRFDPATQSWQLT